MPSDNDRVLIGPSTSIQYGLVSGAHINGLEIDGSLNFSTLVNTRLLVGNLTVMPSGTLQIGTTAAPVSPSVMADLVIADQPLNLAIDPSQYGTGLIALGTVSIHGSPLATTWTTLSAEPRAGDVALSVSGDLSVWRPGDTLVLPDTRQLLSGADANFVAGLIPQQWEEVVIDHVQGNQVFLASPLEFDHFGAHNVDGGLELLPNVALLDRNVMIRSENPQGTRGEVFFTARANVDIEYSRFQDLGRTDAFRALDNTTFDANGHVTHVGTNQDGRFAVHFAELIGPVNATNTGYQFQFVGNTVASARRWAVDVDNTSYGLLDRNVVYDAQGAGFVTEEGSEIGNTFSNNIAIRIQGTHDDGKDGTAAGDYGRGGVGFWFRHGGNSVIGSVAADCTYSGFAIVGYNADPPFLPNFRGADPAVVGQFNLITLTPAGDWQNDVVYGMTTYGLWAAFISGNSLESSQPNTLFEQLQIWNVWNAGVWLYHTSDVAFDHLLILGDEAAQIRDDFGTMGIAGTTYENLNLVVENSRLEGLRIGIAAPANDASTPGNLQPTIVYNTVLKNYVNVVVQPASDMGPRNGNALELRDDLFTLVPGLPSGAAGHPANIQMSVIGSSVASPLALTQPSIVRVYDYNLVPGDNFQVYYLEQSRFYHLPQSSNAALEGRSGWTIGSPVAGMNNAQNWMTYGIAMGGAVAPRSASQSRSDIIGLIAPIADLSKITPQVVLVTPWNRARVIGDPPVRIRYNVNGELPAGAKVYFALDNFAPFSAYNDGGLYNVATGWHKLVAYIGDASGHQLSGTLSSTRVFFVNIGENVTALPSSVPPPFTASIANSPEQLSAAAAISGAAVVQPAALPVDTPVRSTAAQFVDAIGLGNRAASTKKPSADRTAANDTVITHWDRLA